MKTITDNAAQLLYDGTPRLTGFGLPFAEGVLNSPESLRLSIGNHALPSSTVARSYWPDGSVKWCWCQAIVDQSGLLGLQIAPKATSDNADGNAETNKTNSEPENQTTDTASSQTTVLDHSPTLPTWNQSRVSGQTLLCFVPLSGLTADAEKTEGTSSDTASANISIQVQVTLAGQAQPMVLSQLRAQHSHTPISETVVFTGELRQAEQTLKLTAHLERCATTQGFSLKVRLHNPHAARHATGSWDLGDPGSCAIDKFALVFSQPESQPSLLLRTFELPEKPQEPAPVSKYFSSGDFTLTQHGSGGEHWQSPIHWDAQKRLPIKARGFTLRQNTPSDDESFPKEGLRAQPTGILNYLGNTQTPAGALHISLADFWQNFPVQLIGTRGGLRFELFPNTTELQGGESKTWHFSGQLHAAESSPDLAKTPDQNAPPRVRYNHAYLNNSGVFPHMRFSQTTNPLSDLIFRGLTGETNFFQKREATDVYGWRNYGELYADHEAVNSAPGSYFISHYNNQYDPLMGMTLQYLHWGELSWLDLANPLAQHLKDIDIYDTDQDKAEYNGGLFWHTDHYLPAETSSHRSYSKHHTAAYEGYAGGGGPGGQHCYTTGLALQYWLFGDEQAKEKVLQLTRWIRAFYNGGGSVLDRAFRLLTIDFKNRQLTNIGLKAPGFRYPLDRGTGNYLVALLDAFELTQAPEYMREMGSVIKQTVHPSDCLESRDLKDVENAWFYTVFLQALARYLCLKESLQDIDEDYWHGRHSFMAYVEWMREHESFYLDDPAKLEFPNDTWCAQEMRKANLFCFGWYFAQEAEPEYLARAENFYQYIEQKLSHSPEAEYTRILALLMQNDGVRQKFRSRPRSEVAWVAHTYAQQPGYDPKRIMATFFKDVIKLMRQFSPKRELHWIKLRFPKLFR